MKIYPRFDTINERLWNSNYILHA